MIRTTHYELLYKSKETTNILIKFEDRDVNKDFYNFIKDRLKNFQVKINNKYPINIDSECDYFEKVLFIQIILSIPDIPNTLNLEQIINHISYTFTLFYEREIQIFKNKNDDKKFARNKKMPKL